MDVLLVVFAVFATCFEVNAQLCGIEISSYWCPPSIASRLPCCVEIIQSQIKTFTITNEEEESFIAGLQIGFGSLMAGFDYETDEGGTLETRSVTDIVSGRQVICFEQNHLLCFYRNSTFENGRRVCSAVIHELKISKACFGYGVCEEDACVNDGDDGYENKSLWDKQRTLCIILIFIGVVTFVFLCGSCLCIPRLFHPT